jgi:Xaa-Pro aminopeptidase
MRKPSIDIQICKNRRQELAGLLKGAALILPALPEYTRNPDVNYDYRQETNLYYTTGFEEPESVFVFRPGQKPETVLFVRPKDPLRETWDGFRFGPEAASKAFGIDACYLISELATVLPDLLSPVEKVYYKLKVNAEFDEVFLKALDATRAKLGRSGMGLKPVFDPLEVFGEVRLFKRGVELEFQKKACEITSEGHIAGMRFTKPGVNERQIEATIRHKFSMLGSPRMGYNAIVATGAGATTLHYNFNDQECLDGQLVLVDMGAEFQHYTGDITRTFPVNGKFSATQKKFYGAVLNAQKEILRMVRPGLLFKDPQTRTIELLTESLIELGILKSTKEVAIEKLEYKKYYPHGVSHWLGMDVHDVGPYAIQGQSRPLQVGMCFTVEPGLYVPYDDMSAPEEYRGMGVRIEDNIVVTETGHYNMTQRCPKEIDDIENMMANG